MRTHIVKAHLWRYLSLLFVGVPLALSACGQHVQQALPQTVTSTPVHSALSASVNGCDASISTNFNGTPIPSGSTLWFTAIVKVSGVGGTPASINLSRSTISFTTDGVPYNVVVPNSSIKIDPASSSASITSNSNGWSETVPYPFSGNVLLAAVQLPVSSNLSGGIQNVTWSGHFTSSQSGLTVQWAWSAAVYKQFNTDYDALGVKPVDANSTSQYLNSDHAGTPENYKVYVTGGATGGGGSNYTGGLSGTTAVTPCVGWTPRAPMPTGRGGVAVGVINGILYAVGGHAQTQAPLTTNEAYNPATNTWTTKAPIPTPRDAASAGVINGILYVAGGDGNNSSLEAYDPSTDTWTEKQPMLFPLTTAASAVVNGKLMVAGGTGGGNCCLNILQIYDPATDSWQGGGYILSGLAPFPYLDQQSAGAGYGGLFYVLGGDNINGCCSVFPINLAYDVITNAWTQETWMPTARFDLGAGVVNGLIYAIGGASNATCCTITAPPLGTLNVVEAFDPSSNTWSSSQPLPVPLAGMGVGVIDNTLYVVGGDSSSTSCCVNTAYAYTP